ncbi:MAG: SDR family oxidoreductase [Bacteroidetes bacterium]|nr:SDR family oxidoreductase [Bacteroidota bacterium]
MANDLLKGKKGIIFGALDEKSIAWKVAERVYEQGGKLILTNAPIALRMGKINELGEKVNAEIISADATSTEDLEALINQSTEKFGGKIDFILHSIGMSPNVRKKKSYTDINYDYYLKTLDISAISLHKVLQTAFNLDAISEGGSVVTLSYIAAQKTFPGYGDMAEAKAMLESIVRSFGYQYAIKNKVRVNSISQSPTMTTAGSGVTDFDKFYAFADKLAPLGNASTESCADLCIALFSDLTKMVTMQNIYNDGGFSTTGMSEKLFEMFK